MDIVLDMLVGFKYFMIYMFSNAIVMFVINKLWPLPKEVFRKLFHFIAFSSVIVMIYSAKEWVAAALIPIGLILLMMPGLKLASGNAQFTSMMSERRPGELKSSLIQLFGTMSLIILCPGGYLGTRSLQLQLF